MDMLAHMPAMVVLERIPVPTLATSRDGVILFANSAFAAMVGYQQDGLAGLAETQIFHAAPAEVAARFGLDNLADLVVELRHCEGWPVWARMSRSALMRRDDRVVLATFDNLTERLWIGDL